MLSAKLKEAAGNSADATLYVDDVFSTWLYTGNGSTQTITNGIDLAGKGGMVWVKSRSAATDHKLTDTVRGATKALISDTTGAETTDSTGLTAFSSTGFSLGANSVYNTNAATYASWTFRKAAKFFDVVTYTGNGTTTRNIAHNLGSTPGFIIVKRTDTAADWKTFHTSTATQMALNLTAAPGPTAWAGGVINSCTSTTFQTGDYAGSVAATNASGGTYVAYLFAHDTSSTGIIQCGSFTSDGSANATVNLGWEPQYLIAKPVADTGNPFINNWLIYDSMRGWPTSGVEAMLKANTSEAEGATAAKIYPTATGFNYLSGIASQTFIYMAIRMPNKPPTTGTQVFSPYTRSGNNTVTTVTGVGFSPDMVMGNSRESGYYPGWTYDRLRGTDAGYILTPSTGLETYDPSTTITISGVQNAYILPTSNPNRSAATAGYVDYRFKRAPGFFDEVCYTGTGIATTQAHNLTVVPELMIVKARSSAGSNWVVYVASLGNTQALFLNLTNVPAVASNIWNNTSPTSSVFTIGTAGGVNASATTYVAYLFATLAGISKVGSYTGNGTGQSIACGFGSAGARFVLIKRTDSTGDWYTYDSARGLTSGSSPYLLLNSAAAEVTGNNGVYASSGGFTLGSTASTTTNISGASYIFLAVA
jgi:hypothetical protein